PEARDSKRLGNFSGNTIFEIVVQVNASGNYIFIDNEGSTRLDNLTPAACPPRSRGFFSSLIFRTLKQF
ncbi:MAG TPA: hypothetical protein VGC97_21305, partial [Pyrinomonadaceae bacterium]